MGASRLTNQDHNRTGTSTYPKDLAHALTKRCDFQVSTTLRLSTPRGGQHSTTIENQGAVCVDDKPGYSSVRIPRNTYVWAVRRLFEEPEAVIQLITSWNLLDAVVRKALRTQTSITNSQAS